jgi:hypothetical protein
METVKVKYGEKLNPSFFIGAAREVYYNFGRVKNLRSCNAKMYYSFDEKIVVLKSYDTLVAIAYIPDHYCIDYSRVVRREITAETMYDSQPQPMANSHTTSQQIYKFCKDNNIDLIWQVYPTEENPEYIEER